MTEAYTSLDSLLRKLERRLGLADRDIRIERVELVIHYTAPNPWFEACIEVGDHYEKCSDCPFYEDCRRGEFVTEERVIPLEKLAELLLSEVFREADS